MSSGVGDEHAPRPVGGLLRLGRPGNSLLAGAGVLVGAAASGIDLQGPGLALPLALAAGVGIVGTATGNAWNDVTDHDLDRHAHPYRPLPSGQLSHEAGRRAVAAGWVLTLVLAAALNLPVLALAAANLAGLALYERVLKKRGLLGNIMVALLAGTLFPLGALAVEGALHAPLILGALAALAHLGRELLKDAEDVTYDRALRRTFAVRNGPKAAALTAGATLVAAIIVSPAPHFLVGWSDRFLLALIPADLVFAAAAVRGLRDPAGGRALAKGAMVLALGAFLAGALS